MTIECPFCARLAMDEPLLRNELGAVITDAFPVSLGHLLVIPTRHESDFFALSGAEQHALVDLVARARAWLHEHHHPAGYNVGINVGDAGGQTIGHAHIHVIPRFTGDVEDPRGGVRWVLPARAAYWRP